jgi:aryl-alcohol dehydrogenase-like predicted oxidoreductase
MGTWQAGKDMWVGIDDAATHKAIQKAYEEGITTFDTAEAYGRGHSERIIGEAVGDFRPQVMLATKVFANHLKYDQVMNACHRSLQNLNTEWIDLYQIHWPSGSFGSEVVPIEETMNALNKLKEQGKIRAIGVSNFSLDQLQEASTFGRIDSLQPPYSLFWRQVENETMPYCREQKITILAYSPMAQGLLTGKFGPDHQFEKGDHRAGNKLFQAPHFERVQTALSELRPIAERRGVSLAQLALAWVTSHPATCAIAGARNARQISDNARAGDMVLSEEETAEINAIGRRVTDHLDPSPVMWDFVK